MDDEITVVKSSEIQDDIDIDIHVNIPLATKKRYVIAITQRQDVCMPIMAKRSNQYKIQQEVSVGDKHMSDVPGPVVLPYLQCFQLNRDGGWSID